MTTLADRIAAELQVLVGEPISDCWRVANMPIFEFESGLQNVAVRRCTLLARQETYMADSESHLNRMWSSRHFPATPIVANTLNIGA